MTISSPIDSFQASGDHLPVAPPAPPQPVPTSGYQPQQQYQPQSYQAPAPQSSFRSNDYGDDGSYDTRYNDPSFGQQQQSYQQPAPQPQYRPAPAPVQPAYNPAPQQQYHQPPPQPQYQPQPQPSYYTTTPNPHRFSPPGKLSLNRTPDGFTYSFNKV